ncbi:MAG: hypothetical protein DME25_21515 [Verrucomicrobia bacterium]|nr:MAG: hypothetical protein DME25_21515 [Verrucomicrobiota bacterium]
MLRFLSLAVLVLGVFSAEAAHGAGKRNPPAAPSNLAATGVSSSQINVTWMDVANETGFRIQRGPSATGPWTVVAITSAGVTAWADTGITPSTTCYYGVCAYNSKGSSCYSGPVSATTLAGTSCTYAISPGSCSFAAGGGSSSVSVSGCTTTWSVTGCPSWITIQSGGTGPMTVSVSALANTATTTRSATLTVAGSAFTVSQAAASAPTAPVNDPLANATTESGTPVTVTGSNVGGTKEAGEPAIAGNCGGASVWWSWTAPSAGTATISTAGSSFDTLLGVFTGSSVSALTLVAQNDDAGGGPTTSLVTFNAVSGTTYKIAVDGYNGAQGNINLSVSLTASAPPPSCTFALSSTSASFSAASGGGSVNVIATPAGCTGSWGATANATWLHTSSSGNGSGTASYTVDANGSTSSRSGTLTIAGTTFTVTQAGTTPCTYSLSASSGSCVASGGSGSANTRPRRTEMNQGVRTGGARVVSLRKPTTQQRKEK